MTFRISPDFTGWQARMARMSDSLFWGFQSYRAIREIRAIRSNHAGFRESIVHKWGILAFLDVPDFPKRGSKVFRPLRWTPGTAREVLQ